MALDVESRRREGDATDPARRGRESVPGAKEVAARADVVTARFAVEEGRPHRMNPGAGAARRTVDAIATPAPETADDYSFRMTWSPISRARPAPPSARRFADHETTRDASSTARESDSRPSPPTHPRAFDRRPRPI